MIRRIETSRPGELVHIDVKKQARIPKGGGWRVNGIPKKNRQRTGPGGPGWATPTSTRPSTPTPGWPIPRSTATRRPRPASRFWRRAKAFFESYGITVERVLTDNGSCYSLARTSTHELHRHAIKHTRTKPYRPQTNGKVERYNRTLLNEWAYARPYRSEAARTRALDTWLHMYNHHRHHTAIGGPPVSRVNNLVGQNS